jgi:small nuclear ribonucleoprotein (snRNP)-like protein
MELHPNLKDATLIAVSTDKDGKATTGLVKGMLRGQSETLMVKMGGKGAQFDGFINLTLPQAKALGIKVDAKGIVDAATLKHPALTDAKLIAISTDKDGKATTGLVQGILKGQSETLMVRLGEKTQRFDGFLNLTLDQAKSLGVKVDQVKLLADLKKQHKDLTDTELLAVSTDKDGKASTGLVRGTLDGKSETLIVKFGEKGEVFNGFLNLTLKQADALGVKYD